MRVLPLLVPCVTAALVAQKAPPNTVVQPGLGERSDAIVRAASPPFWGSVLVVRQGQVVLASGYGLADRKKVPMQAGSLFDLGGTAALLTTLLAHRMVADRKLRLEDPVARHLDGWPVDKAAITIGHLVARTSGLPADAVWAGGAANATRTALQAIARTTLVDRPGAAFHDSSLNSVLLAIVLEEVGKVRFDKLLADRILKPAGMRTAGACNAEFDARLVTQRLLPDGRGEQATAYEHNWAHRGARNVLASVLDVHELLLAGTGGKLVGAEAWAAAHAPLPGGAAFSVSEVPSLGLVRVAGQSPGFACCWLVHAPTRSWIVIAAGDAAAARSLERDLVLELSRDVAPTAGGAPPPAAGPGSPPTGSTPSGSATPDRSGGGAVTADAVADLERFVGTFVLPAGSGRFVVERRGGGLHLRGEGLQASARVLGGWSPTTESRLRRAEDRGLAIFGWLLSDDASVRDGFVGPEAADPARAAVQQWLARMGPHLRTEFVGSRLTERAGESWFRLVGARGEVVFQAIWSDDRRFARIASGASAPEFGLDLAMLRPDMAAGRAPTGDVVVTVEGRGAGRRLVFEDGNGIVDCPLADAGGR